MAASASTTSTPTTTSSSRRPSSRAGSGGGKAAARTTTSGRAFHRADVDRSGTIDLKEFEDFARDKFGKKAIPRESEQEMPVKDSLDEFTAVRLFRLRANGRTAAAGTAARFPVCTQPLQPALSATVL